jgi:bacterioferritin (cytochrome b1)
MLNNHEYNIIKLLNKLSCIIWFLDKHAIADAQQANDQASIPMLQQLRSDTEKHIEKLRNVLCK